jgi:hypothetical protein
MVPVHTPWPLVHLDGINAHFNFIWVNWILVYTSIISTVLK